MLPKLSARTLTLSHSRALSVPPSRAGPDWSRTGVDSPCLLVGFCCYCCCCCCYCLLSPFPNYPLRFRVSRFLSPFRIAHIQTANRPLALLFSSALLLLLPISRSLPLPFALPFASLPLSLSLSVPLFPGEGVGFFFW